ncbi:hypothetical protein K431DRAFT_311992 [Polychaeton citri CBS 116435]|uniref:CID domain-containing protein n=1 Tax=Polychaeton citri CBS 116435 TaxID=1314669 RepID=A0A9P4UN63_9PEZI|nr:hypothetical protein K431DRAFT_311992 [Polychaeton citri CBS 116435]
MSARSPRGSFSGVSSAEVAADFADSLKDLQGNNRYEISNLTIIAKENTEHAQDISQALINHIKTTPPPRKLPAFYVLDSIVKNVGTPYTVYLSRNLYDTFMQAYTLVDGNVRRQMDAMLKTWKEPVPGSMDPRPVFLPEVVKPIETALMRARTAALKHGQPPIRNTPTPPNLNGQYSTPPAHFQQLYAQSQQVPTHFQTTPVQQQQQPPYPIPPYQHNEVDVVKANVASLVKRTQSEWASNLGDKSVRDRLQALLDLQKVLDLQQLDPVSMQAVKAQVDALSAQAPRHSTPIAVAPPVASTPQWQPPLLAHQPYATPQQTLPFQRPPSAVQPPQPAPVFAPGQLESLQALFTNGQKPSTPQMRNAAPSLQSATHGQLNAMQNGVASAAQPNTNDLISSLFKSGFQLPSVAPTPSQQPPPSLPVNMAQPPAAALPDFNNSVLASLMRTMPNITSVAPGASKTVRWRQPTASSLKTFNPSLVYALYDNQPNQCSNCGRRFPGTEAGREKKQRHLDWHFRTNQRLADPAITRGNHRQPFVDEHEWVALKDFDASTATADATAKQAQPVKNRPEEQFVRAPPGKIVNKCSICQEDMKASHPNDDWVFMNAARWNGKIVHATCLAEMTGGSAPTPVVRGNPGGGGSLAAALGVANEARRDRSATPDSLLGKRKAEAAMMGQGSRMRVE